MPSDESNQYLEPDAASDPNARVARVHELAARFEGVTLTKGHGTGNDFVLYTDADGALPANDDDAAALCDRHLGIGADGLIRAVRSAALPEGQDVLNQDPSAEWFMDYRNSDGSLSQMCGNGVRVYVHYLLDQGLAQLSADGEIAIGTRDGVKRVRRSADGYSVDMGPWRLIDPNTAAARGMDAMVRTDGVDVDRPGLSISMGNPHTVVALASEQELAELSLGRPPAVEPVPSEGTNVEFVVPADPLVAADGIADVTMRVHERGSGETQSCGTGACAAAAAVRYWAGQGAADSWRVAVPGGVVGVTFARNPGAQSNDVEHAFLSGPAVLVARLQLV